MTGVGIVISIGEKELRDTTKSEVTSESEVILRLGISCESGISTVIRYALIA